MKTMMKKTAAYLLAFLLVFQMVPAFAGAYISNEIQKESELLELLKIINESGPYILKGQTLQLLLPNGYSKVKWSSSDESVATVDQNGLVTAVEVGKTTITVVSGSDKSKTNIEVVAPAEKKTDTGKATMTILVNGNKIKTQYDGKPHEITYTYSSDSSDFDRSKVMLNADVASRSLPGAIKGKLTAGDFSYADKNVDVTFIVNDGSVYITPIEVTVKADDLTITLEELKAGEPNLTATVTGEIEGEQVSYMLTWDDRKEAGEHVIEPVGADTQGGYSVRYESGTLTVTDDGKKTQNLYNLLKIDGDNLYYRLKIGSIVAEEASKIGMGKTLKKEQYSIPDGQYDFSGLILNYKGEDYKYSATVPDGDSFESCYTISSETVTTNVRITGDDKWFKNSAGFLDGSEAEYKAQGIARTTPGFHRDYIVKLHKGKAIEKKIEISADWPSGKIAYPGAQITLTAELTGYKPDSRLQWQYSEDKENWNDEPGANALTFTYTLDEKTAKYYWRLTVE